jgi:hypothetical protein
MNFDELQALLGLSRAYPGGVLQTLEVVERNDVKPNWVGTTFVIATRAFAWAGPVDLSGSGAVVRPK